MTVEITILLAILGLALVLFVRGRPRMDAVALLVLSLLAIFGLVSPSEALAGFSNPAVATVWAVFVLSGALSRSGVAAIVGRRLLRLAGRSETRLALVVMIAAAALSAFMNNVGVAALLLPVVMDICRSTGVPPSRLLLPLAYATLLGGLTTQIGTPPNILVSEALRAGGLPPFGLFDYAPVGGAILIVGIAFLALVRRRLLPARAGATAGAARELQRLYAVGDRLFSLAVPADSALVGRRLAETRLGSVLDVFVAAIVRERGTVPSPGPDERIQAGDRLVVLGDPGAVTELAGGGRLVVALAHLDLEEAESEEIGIVEIEIPAGSPLAGSTLQQIDARDRLGVNVLALLRDGVPRRTGLQRLPLEAGDRLLVQGPRDRLEGLAGEPGLRVAEPRTSMFRLEQRLFVLVVPPHSILADRTLGESRLGSAFGLTVLSVIRDATTIRMPGAEERLQAGDTLLVSGNPTELATLDALAELDVDVLSEPEREALESTDVGWAEAVLAPRSSLAGRTLAELFFREKYGLAVVGILREGDLVRSGLGELPLRHGDALLLHGPRDRIELLASDPDVLVLTESAEPAPHPERAPRAAAVMAATLAVVLLGWFPISIAAVAGATAMVLTRCLTIDEAYRAIEWRAVFLIAGMLPLGTALETSGAAGLFADALVDRIGPLGPRAVMAGLFVATSLGTQVIPTAALVVLMAPIVLDAAAGLGVSPHAYMMAMAMAASASFGSPVSHPANVLVMGPGGYRFADYVRVGLPLTGLVFAVTMLLVPLVWPL